MTGIAVIYTVGIVSPGSAGESCRGMAGGTIQAGQNVIWHGIHHARRGNTIVAGSTIVDDASMIEGCRHEAAGGVTDPAILVSVDMTGFLGCGETGVMTGGAVIHDTGMIEGCRQETRSHVTVATVIVGRHMEVIFAGGGNTIMTGSAVIHDALVFEPGVGKGSRGMAHRAIVGGWNVGRIDLRSLANSVDTIVTGSAVIHDTGMIEHRRGEGATSHVTGTTILGCCNVGRIDLCSLAGGGNTVMAGIAAGGQNHRVGVVDTECGTEAVSIMATAAIGGSCQVCGYCSRLAPGPKGGKTTIMAGNTITGNTRVRQHRCWREPGNRMASVAILASGQMACCFYQLGIGGKELVGMTTFAAIGDGRMLIGEKCGRGEISGGVVAITTYIQRRNMIGFLAYSPDCDISGIAIVAALTIVGDTRVKEGLCRLERWRGGVTNDAILGCWQMIYRLSGTDVTIVTGYAIVNHTRVTEYCPGKGHCIVTIHAILVVGSGRDVIDRLTRTDHVVVARGAVSNDTDMIIGAGGKCPRGMANTTIQKRRHVGRMHAACRTRSIGNMTGRTVVHDTGMIVSADESIGTVAGAAIGGGRWMGIRRG